MPAVEVVDYGGGNLGSLLRCLHRLEVPYTLTARPSGEKPLILPGVGAFGAVAQGLQKAGLDSRLKDLIVEGVPYFGICVGLQILFEESEESPGAAGLGVLGGRVERLRAPKVPQIGWNRIVGEKNEGFVYFVNSYVARPRDPGDVWYRADYHGSFCAAVRRDNVSAVQFHPEKSGDFGQQLIRSWIFG